MALGAANKQYYDWIFNISGMAMTQNRKKQLYGCLFLKALWVGSVFLQTAVS